MKAFLLASTALCCTVLLSGCASSAPRTPPDGVFALPTPEPTVRNISATVSAQGMDSRAARMVVWRASMALEVWNVSDAVTQATVLTESQGGFVEKKIDRGDTSASLTLRIPGQTFGAALTAFEELGTVTSRDMSGADVTEEYVDVEARMKNMVVLRDRLKLLLDRAESVADVLAIEAELNRVQGSIDSMEARIKVLKNQADLATVNLSFQRKPVLGPLGYLYKGIKRGIEKLFVIRE